MQDDNVASGLSKVTAFLQRLTKHDQLCASISELGEMVRHAYGAVNTNATGFLGRHASAVYPVVAVSSHSCSPNLEPMPQFGRQFGFRAKRHIAAGEECTIRYT